MCACVFTLTKKRARPVKCATVAATAPASSQVAAHIEHKLDTHIRFQWEQRVAAAGVGVATLWAADQPIGRPWGSQRERFD